MKSRFQLGCPAVTMLVLLRITIGWHFLYAGIWKLENPSFSSKGFLTQAKGPLAERFQSLVPDLDGSEALHPANRERYPQKVDEYLQRFKQFYTLSEDQLAKAQQHAAARKLDMEQCLKEKQDEIKDYWHELGRLDKTKKTPGREMPYQQKRIWNKKTELQGKAQAWIDELEKSLADFKRDLESLLSDEQRKTGHPGQPLTPVEKIDLVVTYSNIAIGACLIVGLFTRLASFAGGLFLLSIVLAQPDWPGLYPPPHPSAGRALIVNKEFVEMLTMFFLATTHVGRWGGLDFFIHNLFVRPFYRGGRRYEP